MVLSTSVFVVKAATIIWISFCIVFSTAYDFESTKTWLLDQRNEDGSWGEDTPRIIVALHFADRDFFSPENKEGTIVAKQLEIQLAIDLLDKGPDGLETNQLSMYINALTASCLNPRNFYGINLVDSLKTKLRDFDVPTAVVALYNAKEELSFELVHSLQQFIHFKMQEETYWADSYALGLMALSCYDEIALDMSDWIDRIVERLHDAQKTDGSFGNVYTTALVMQALNAVGRESSYNKGEAKDFLESNEKDGSYGDLVATYLVLPTLQDSNLASLRDLSCPETADPKIALPESRSKINLQYSLDFGSHKEVQYVMRLKVPNQTSFFDVMTIAANRDPRFEFLATNFTGGIQVYSISGKANDPEKRLYWNLYATKRTQGPGDGRFELEHSRVTTEFPEEGSHYTFWYKS